MAAIPGPRRTLSSKTTSTFAGERARTAPLAGWVRTRLAWAPADAGISRQAATARIAVRRIGTSGDIAVAVASVVPVLFLQFIDDDLGCGSYIVGDEHAGVAV